VLSQFLIARRQEILAKGRAKLASRTAPHATPIEIEAGVPLFLDQLAAELAAAPWTHTRRADDPIGRSASERGRVLYGMGLSAGQVIHSYGDICQAITELAVESHVPITTDEFRTLNRCLDEAMAEAIAEFGRQRECSIADGATKRRALLAHDLKNLLNVSMLAFDAITEGAIGVAGSTGTMLGHSLTRMNEILHRSVQDAAYAGRNPPDGPEGFAPAQK
jgi:hypothetical protein